MLAVHRGQAIVDISSVGTGVVNIYELWYGCWEQNMGSGQEASPLNLWTMSLASNKDSFASEFMSGCSLSQWESMAEGTPG